MKLVIVESPTKSKTIGKYLGKDFKVLASAGHIRDLPTQETITLTGGKRETIDVENDFDEYYEIPDRQKKNVAELRKFSKAADEIYLATDPDREGEAIAWHLMEVIKPPKNLPVHRVLFNEITPNGIKVAMEHPRDVDQHLVDAQRARRVLDRLVGYKVSKVLWDKVRRGLSAGRVQSIALRLIVDREKEIEAFQPVEYWTFKGEFKPLRKVKPATFWMRLKKIDDQMLQFGNAEQKLRIGSEKDAQILHQELKKASYTISDLNTKEKNRNPSAPFTTAALQREASNKLGFGATRTMQTAQRLYEGVDLGSGEPIGLITYMRTDSPRMAPEAIEGVRDFIKNKYGKDFLPKEPRVYKGKSDAQDAHESIRPTDFNRTPESIRGHLDPSQFRLYALIWRRAVASQMEASRFDLTTVTASSTLGNKQEVIFEAKGEIERFAGWLSVYRADEEESLAESIKDATKTQGEEEEEESIGLPDLQPNETLELVNTDVNQQFTKPPARYNDASLIEKLEKEGIGRPSTYAAIIETVQKREYVVKIEKSFKPTQIGMVVSDLLVEGFAELMEMGYTRHLEEDLDLIEEGKKTYAATLHEFYKPFIKLVNAAGKKMQDLKAGVPTGESCPKCGEAAKGELIKRIGRNGLFLGCTRYQKPKKTKKKKIEESLEISTCDYTRDLEEVDPNIDPPECPLCGETPMVLKRGQYGPFWACPHGPKDCKGIVKADPKGIPAPPDERTEEKCPNCDKYFVKRWGRYGLFTCCENYPNCKTVKREILEGFQCPKCQSDISPRKSRFGKIFYGCTGYPKCDFITWDKPRPISCPQCANAYMGEKVRKPRGKDPITVLLCPECKHEEPLPA